MKLISIRFTTLVILFSMITLTAWSQKGKEKGATTEPAKVTTEAAKPQSGAESIQTYRKIYDTALNYNDFAVATEAMYHLIALQPGVDALKDTLAALYFQRGAWPQVVLLTTELLTGNPSNIGALELRAVANQSLGRAKESLEDYESLYKQNKNPYHLYEIASLQLAMKRFGECEQSVRQLLSDMSIKDKEIAITVQDGRSQQVPLAAAAMNMNGVLDLEQGKKDSAKGHFENAIKVFPEFLLAKNNLDAMAQMK
jgi:tetratricopeptide (TPR) repeat protein